MGFIDYQGTKENRYSDVLEFAKAQQGEEARRIEDARVAKWLAENLKDSRYSELGLNDLLKYIIVKYRKLVEEKEILLSKQDEQEIIDAKLLWNDFCISVIARRLENVGLTEEKRNKYYLTFMDKVFKLDGFTSADKHYSNIQANISYKRYFADCFDLVQEKQFWKWLGRLGVKDEAVLVDFVKTYEQMSILLGYYLYLGIRPQNSEWMKRLDLEYQILEKLCEEYSYGRYKQPNNMKLKNPLYRQAKQTKVTINTKEPIKEIEPDVLEENQEKTVEEPVRLRRAQLNKKLFEELLQKQKLLDYTEACRLLRRCELPENMDELYKELIIQMPILQDSIDKFAEVYKPDMYQFYEYYIPEALRLTATYLEHLDVGIGEKILSETEREVYEAVNKLLMAVNDKLDEIFKFSVMETRAKARALESLMSQDGYVDPNFKII
jgi:hypothetical protein